MKKLPRHAMRSERACQNRVNFWSWLPEQHPNEIRLISAGGPETLRYPNHQFGSIGADAGHVPVWYAMKRVKDPSSLSPLLRNGLRLIPLLSSLLCFELAAAFQKAGSNVRHVGSSSQNGVTAPKAKMCRRRRYATRERMPRERGLRMSILRRIFS